MSKELLLYILKLWLNIILNYIRSTNMTMNYVNIERKILMGDYCILHLLQFWPWSSDLMNAQAVFAFNTTFSIAAARNSILSYSRMHNLTESKYWKIVWVYYSFSQNLVFRLTNCQKCMNLDVQQCEEIRLPNHFFWTLPLIWYINKTL